MLSGVVVAARRWSVCLVYGDMDAHERLTVAGFLCRVLGVPLSWSPVLWSLVYEVVAVQLDRFHSVNRFGRITTDQTLSRGM